MIRTYFDQKAMQELNTSLQKEYLLTADNGTYSASTISGCNTRKYHGLLVVPQPQIDEENHVIVSALEETIRYKGQTYNLGMHQYPGVYHPEGYKYIKDFFGNPIPKWVYSVDDCTLTKELLLSPADDTVLVRYTINEATSDVNIDLRPFLAFRCVHHLSKASLNVNKKVKPVTNGIRLRMYAHYAELYMQLTQEAEFITAPDWYYNIEYNEEKSRGYDYKEDLYVPGHFSLLMKKGEQLVFSAGLKEHHPKILKTRFSTLLKKKPALNTIGECLQNAAQQFVIKSNKHIEIKAGYYWFNRWGRDTFIALPGLTLSAGHPKKFKTAVDAMLPDLKDGLFPNVGSGKNAVYNSVDAALWFIWAIQQYAKHAAPGDVWKQYGKHIKHILEHYKKGTLHNIHTDKGNLVYAGEEGYALTWMDSVVDRKPVTPRIGKAVEINALWYNAVCFAEELAASAGDNEFADNWKDYAAHIKTSFIATFWDEQKGYLADCVEKDHTDWSLRPNQIFALSLPYSPVPKDIAIRVLETVKKSLLTPRGLRTLAANDKNYRGIYAGDQKARDTAYHQGIAWPWLLGHFAEAYIKFYGDEGITFVQHIYEQFKPALEEKCLYTIAEVYNGDEPYEAGGAVSQAWSVAELLRIREMIVEHKTKLAENIPIKAIEQ